MAGGRCDGQASGRAGAAQSSACRRSDWRGVGEEPQWPPQRAVKGASSDVTLRKPSVSASTYEGSRFQWLTRNQGVAASPESASVLSDRSALAPGETWERRRDVGNNSKPFEEPSGPSS